MASSASMVWSKIVTKRGCYTKVTVFYDNRPCWNWGYSVVIASMFAPVLLLRTLIVYLCSTRATNSLHDLGESQNYKY